MLSRRVVGGAEIAIHVCAPVTGFAFLPEHRCWRYGRARLAQGRRHENRCLRHPQLFKLGFSRTPSVNVVQGKSVEDDCGNAAPLFIERYYRCFPFQDRTVEALLPMAAHSILMGAEINGSVE